MTYVEYSNRRIFKLNEYMITINFLIEIDLDFLYFKYGEIILKYKTDYEVLIKFGTFVYKVK